MEFTRNLRELEYDRDRPARVVGITGGIASGKTEATSALEQQGYAVVDADAVSRELFGRGSDGEKSIAALFPDCAKNGALDRRALRALISRDKKAKRRLEEFTHPKITAEIKRRLDALIKREKRPIILSAPLLFETPLAGLCDRTVCIVCPRYERVKRLTARDGVTEAEANAIIDSQIPDTERATLADYIVPSDTGRDTFRREIVELVREIEKSINA